MESISVKAERLLPPPFFHPITTTVSHDLLVLTTLVIEENVNTTTAVLPAGIEAWKASFFSSSTLASSVLFYFIFVSFISSMANPWNLYRIGAREWPSTLSTAPRLSMRASFCPSSRTR